MPEGSRRIGGHGGQSETMQSICPSQSSSVMLSHTSITGGQRGVVVGGLVGVSGVLLVLVELVELVVVELVEVLDVVDVVELVVVVVVVPPQVLIGLPDESTNARPAAAVPEPFLIPSSMMSLSALLPFVL